MPHLVSSGSDILLFCSSQILELWPEIPRSTFPKPPQPTKRAQEGLLLPGPPAPASQVHPEQRVGSSTPLSRSPPRPQPPYLPTG